MELGQGEIYFVTEQNGLGHTEFVKIGLVGDAEGRSSLGRMKEHQTGNPRILKLLDVVKTAFVTTVESRLHNEFAARRVSGEWFNLDHLTLQAAIERCKVLADEYQREIPVLEQADRLANIPSSESLADQMLESHMWRDQYLSASRGDKILEDATERLRSHFSKLYAEGKDVRHVFKISERAGSKTFDREAFKERYFDLWQRHQITTASVSNGGIRVKPSTETLADGLGIVEAEKLNAEISAGIDSADSSRDALSELHNTYLELIGMQPLYAEQKRLAGARLKVLCGEYGGIKNICTWKRTLKEETKLDDAAIKELHNEEYLACTSVGPPIPVREIWRKARPQAGSNEEAAD